jgi:hypothetical protein
MLGSHHADSEDAIDHFHFPLGYVPHTSVLNTELDQHGDTSLGWIFGGLIDGQ